MSDPSNGLPWSGRPASDLLTQASSLLSREMARGGGGTQVQSPAAATSAVRGVGESLTGIAGRICPVTAATIPLSPPDKDRLRQQAHELVETLLALFSQGIGEKVAPKQAAPDEDRVPLFRCVAPVQAGAEASATMKVANDEDT